MKVISGLSQLELTKISDVAVTLGTFDGVHLGHKRIIEVLLEKGRQMNLQSALVTFNPHPQMVLGRRGPTEILTTPPPQRIVYLELLYQIARQSPLFKIQIYLSTRQWKP